ncbi:MAG: hypothetical protein MK086_14255 [Flavobacteriales bacterium]|nr:hypothetical protein [Flavobacteriales bacterium]
MEKHKFTIAIGGEKKEATEKANAVATLASYLDAKTLRALAHVVKTDPKKVAIAKSFLGGL